jgi:hypothetical protein
MKRTALAACVAAIATCVVLLLMPDAHAAAISIASVGDKLSHIDYQAAGLVLAVGLDALRSQHAALTTRAAAKVAEVKDGMAAEAVRAIETDHAAILADIATVAGAISAEERKAPPTNSVQPTDPAAAARAAIETERGRVADITDLATRHGMPAAFAAEHVRKGTAIGEVRTLVLDHVAAEAAKRGINPRAQLGTDAAETARNAVEAAIMLRANPQAIKPDTEVSRTLLASAREFRGMTLLEIGRVYVEDTTGRRLRGLSKMDLAGHLLGLGQQRDAGGQMSTSDFPSILANVINKRLRSAYEVAPQNWKQISRQSNAPDFKTKYVVQLSNLPKLKEVKEGGEYQYASLTDGKETYSLVTYGRIVPVTRQTLINDDLGAFDRIPMMMGRVGGGNRGKHRVGHHHHQRQHVGCGGAVRCLARQPRRHGAAITVASLNAGRAAMRKQKGLAVKAAEQEPLNLAPKFIAVSPDKETEAQSFLASIYATKAGDVNPFAQSLLQMTEARLTGNAWYLSPIRRLIDTIEYAYLEGEEGLYTETRFGFEVDGIEVKGRLDFAAKAIDWRGMYKNPGA